MASTLQADVLKILRSLPRCWAVKVISANKRGCPDVLCCYEGRFVAIEVKEGRDVVSPIQKEQMARIADPLGADGEAYTIKSIEEFEYKVLYRSFNLHQFKPKHF